MKKWTYLVVAGLLAGATPMLQSCVDNDEPEGINVLRKAKAELIAAKKVVQEAEAARLKAEAAKLEADAALVKAQAEIAKAQAELINAQTEAARAEIEIRIAQAKAEAEHQQHIWEQADKLAEVAYQQALAQLALVKAQLSVQQQNALQAYINDVDAKKAIYDEKMAAVREAQRNWIMATEEVEYREENKDFYTFYLQQSLKREQAYVESLKSFIEEELNPAIAEAEAMTPGENVARRDELQAEYDALQAKIVEAQKAVDLARAEMAPDYDELAALQNAANAALNAPIKIAEFKYEFPYYIVNGYQGEVTVVRRGTYSLNNDAWLSFNLNRIESAKNAIKDAARDENQNAWTAESLAMTKSNYKNQQAYVKGLKARWQDAVNAYRTGTEYGTIANLKGDAEAGIAGYDDLLAAIKAYNDLVEPYLTAKAAFDNLLAETDWWTTWQTYEDQRQAARDEYDELVATLNQELVDADNSYWQSNDILWYEYDALYARWNELNIEVSQKGSTATAAEIQAVADAKTAYETKMTEINTNRKNYWGSWDSTAGQHVDGTRDKAVAANNNKIELAEATRDRKIAEINLAEEKKYQENNAAYAAQYETLLNAKNEAEMALDNAFSAAQSVYGALTSRVTDYSYYNSALGNAYSNKEEFEITDSLPLIGKWAVENKVRQLSIELYGSTGSNQFDDDRLVELTKADIDAKLAENYGLEPWEITGAYTWYGAYGWELYYEAQITRAEALLGVTDAQLAEMTADLQAEADKLVADYEAAVAVAEEAQAAADEKEAEIDAALAELQAVVDELRTEARYLNEILLVYYQYSAGEYSQDQIDALVADLKEWKADLEEYLVELEYDVTVAEKNLADWNNNEIAAAEAMKVALDEAQAAADVAKENLDIAQERLQKAIEAMAVSAE
ncbi:MAG: hypothetical protein ACI4CA_07555 [Bacteroides sp.]